MPIRHNRRNHGQSVRGRSGAGQEGAMLLDRLEAFRIAGGRASTGAGRATAEALRAALEGARDRFAGASRTGTARRRNWTFTDDTARPAPSRRAGWREDPYVWGLGLFAYLIIALIMAIGISERDRHAETALDLTMRRAGAELALSLSSRRTAALPPETQAALDRLWSGAIDGLARKNRLSAEARTARGDSLWSAGPGPEGRPRTAVTTAFPVPGQPDGLTVIVSRLPARGTGGIVSVLALFTVFALVPGLGVYFLARTGTGARTRPDATGEPGQDTAQDAQAQRSKPLAEALIRARCGLCQWDEGADDIQVSRSLLALLGYPRPDTDFDAMLSRQAFSDLLGGEDTALLARIERDMRGGKYTFDMTVEMRHRSGRATPMRLAGIATPMPGSPRMRIAAILSDHAGPVGETVGARPASPLKLALDVLSDGIAVWNADGLLVDANPAFADRLGLGDRLAPGKLRRDQLEAVNNPFDKDGRVYSLRTVPLGDHGAMTTIADITAETSQRRTIEALQRTIDDNASRLESIDTALEAKDKAIAAAEARTAAEAERADAAQHAMAEFLANASHELRTPLNAILGFSEMMGEEIYGPLGNPKYKEYVDDIHASGESLLGLIQDLLDMSRLSSGRIEMDPKRIDVADLLEDSLRLARPQAEAKDLDLAMGDVQVPSAWADEAAAKRILLHLLSNATKFTPAGGEITLSAHADLRMINISVTDTGIGIEPEDLGRIGQPFARTRRSEESGQPGMGLGLAMSRSLAELNGGSIKVTSTPGAGTTVTLSLPRRPVSSAAAPPKHATSHAA